MNWLQKISKKEYIGNCTDCLEGEFAFSNDATELAQIIENGRSISFAEIIELCVIEQSFLEEIHNMPDRFEFFVNDHVGLAWIYDNEKDVHYFFG